MNPLPRRLPPTIGNFQDEILVPIPNDPQQRSEVRHRTYRVVALDAQGQPLKPEALTEDQARTVIQCAREAPRVAGPFEVALPSAPLVKRVQIIEDKKTLPYAVPLSLIASFTEDPTPASQVSREWQEVNDEETFKRWSTDSWLSYFITEALKTLPPNASLTERVQATVNKFNEMFPEDPAYKIQPPRPPLTPLDPCFQALDRCFRDTVIMKGRSEVFAKFPDLKDGMIALVRAFPTSLETVPDELKKDKKLVLDVVKKDGLALQYALPPLNDDPEVVSAAIQNNPMALEFASERLRDDEKLVLSAVKRKGHALGYASRWLKKNKEIVLAAVSQNGGALQWVSPELRKDKEIVFAALKSSRLALSWVPSDMFQDKAFVLVALRYDKDVWWKLSPEMRKDLDVRLASNA